MPREYRVVFEGVTVSAAQDLFQIKGATGKMLKITRFTLKDVDTSLPTAQMIQWRCRFLPATVTDGSGGGTCTPRPLDPGDPAASFTCKINNTSKATTGGTAAVLGEGGEHIYNGVDEEIEAYVGPSESFVFELLSSVSGTVTMSGMVCVEEAGG